MRNKLMATLAVVGTLFAFAMLGGNAGTAQAASNGSNAETAITTPSSSETVEASATLVRPFPNGVSQSNPGTAWQQVATRASWDQSYAGQIAASAGASAFAAADYRVVGYGRVSGGANSGVSTSTGRTIPTANTRTCDIGKKALIVINIKTSNTVEICVGCGNPRIKAAPRSLPAHKWAKGTAVNFNKRVVKTIRHICPSGQPVRVVVDVRHFGWARSKVSGIVWGRLQAQLDIKVQSQTRTKVNVTCGKFTPKPNPPAPCPPGTEPKNGACVYPPPPPASKDVCPNIPGDQPVIPQGYVYTTDGKCVRPQVYAFAESRAIAVAEATCPDGTTARAEAEAYAKGEAYGDTYEEAYKKAVADKDQKFAVAWADAQAKARASVKCAPAQPANKAPSVTIEDLWLHIKTNRGGRFCAIVSDPDTDLGRLSVTFSARRGSTSSAFRPDPTGSPGKWCTNYTAPATTGDDTITVTVSDGSLSDSKSHTFLNPTDA